MKARIDMGMSARCDGYGTIICHCGGDICVCGLDGEECFCQKCHDNLEEIEADYAEWGKQEASHDVP